MTLERSHGKLRVTRPRLRDVSGQQPPSTRAGGRDASGRFAAGNTIGTERAAKHALTAPLRRALEQGMADAVAAGEAPEARAQLARAALVLYRAGRRELETSSVLVCTHLVRWAIGSVLAQRLALAADAAGIESELGLRLLDRAHVCEGRAERASVAALELAGVLSGSTKAATPWLEPDDGGGS